MSIEINPRIEILKEKKLLGIKKTMSLSDNKTNELWKSFLARRAEVLNKLSEDMISMQVYNKTYFVKFSINNTFEKWASVEVSDFEFIPNGMESFILEAGLYAVFDYKGSSNDTRIFEYIFGVWLANSDFVIDDRPHFEVLGDKYKNLDPNSEEEIWIPIKKKFSGN